MNRLLGIAFKREEIPLFDGLAHGLGMPFDVLALGFQYEGNSWAGHIFAGLVGQTFPSDNIDGSVSELASGYSHIASVSSMSSKDLLPRLAVRLDGAMITDVTAVFSPEKFQRPFQAGSVLGQVEVLGSPVLLTFRPASFEKPPQGPTVKSSDLEIKVRTGSRIVESTRGETIRPELSQAKLVVSGGRPLKDRETFERVIGGFADAFGGAVGATRAAVDAGIAPNECQVGQTGKIVAPDLYIAAGISGSTQHMAGIKDSKLIVAINKDPDAPIFGSADLGIVGDLYDVLPHLASALKSE